MFTLVGVTSLLIPSHKWKEIDWASSVPLSVGRILLANEKIGYNVLVCMGEVLK